VKASSPVRGIDFRGIELLASELGRHAPVSAWRADAAALDGAFVHRE
jgi:hypothetical protein